MSYTYGFFDAVDLGSDNYDRVYSSAEFSHYWALLVGDGVFGQPSTSLNVLAMEPVAMRVKVAPGTGWIKGHYLTVPDNMDEVIAIPVANPSLPRIDSIIMALNNPDRDMKLYVRSGTAAVSPNPVTLQRDADVWELELAQITVAAGAGNITQTAIKDMRTDPNRCGIVTGLIDQFDVSGFFTAAQASFNEWFENVQGQLDGDVAGNLQNQINKNAAGIATINATTLKADTKTALGLPASAVPDDAFKVLANIGNLHVWEKSTKENNIEVGSSTTELTIKHEYTIYNTASVKNGSIVLSDGNRADYYDMDSLAGKYYEDSTGDVYKLITLTGSVSGYGYRKYASSLVSVGTSYIPCDFVEYITSIHLSSYPADGVLGDFYYTYVGQLGGGARIEVGSYVGTGTYGESNANEIKLSFKPELVIIQTASGAGNRPGVLFMRESLGFVIGGAGSPNMNGEIGGGSVGGNVLFYDDGTVRWYGKGTYPQFNNSKDTYYYCAFG